MSDGGTPSPDINRRINERAERRADFERFPGYWRLTPRQRDIVQVSEYMQNLANRAGPSARNAAGRFQEQWQCFQVIQNLEEERAIDLSTRDIPSNFFDAEYEMGDVESQIRVEEFRYPCIVLFRRTWPNHTKSVHSGLFLGDDSQDRAMIWEKIGAFPFRKTALRGVIEMYTALCKKIGHDLEIGIRKVRCLKSAEHPDGVIEPEKPLH